MGKTIGYGMLGALLLLIVFAALPKLQNTILGAVPKIW